MTFSTRTGRAAALAVAALAVLSACRSEEKTGATPNNCSKKCSLTETRPLAGFNDGADGFVCGENADSLQLIASAPTWSGRLHEGSHCLQVSGPDMPANRWRTVFREYPEGLDLSDTPFVSFAVHTEGGAYGADYYVRLTVGRGGRKFESMAKVTPKEWNVTIFVRGPDRPGRVRALQRQRLGMGKRALPAGRIRGRQADRPVVRAQRFDRAVHG